MTVANHALVGASIALAIHQPLLALPLAFGSHFVLDALPHLGFEVKGMGYAFRQKKFWALEVFDLIGLVILLLTFNFAVWTTAVAALLAISPDFEWLSREFLEKYWGKKFASTAFNRFHKKVQWCERSWGIYVEIGFFVVVYLLARKYLLHEVWL
jgi:hypothetical protein